MERLWHNNLQQHLHTSISDYDSHEHKVETIMECVCESRINQSRRVVLVSQVEAQQTAVLY